jgi:hypothetical protein
VNFKKKYKDVLHLLPKRAGKGRPSNDEMVERVKAADALLTKLRNGDLKLDIVPTKEAAVDVPVIAPEPEETAEQIIERMRQKFENINAYAHGVVNKAVRGLVISGPGGVGKTETLVRIFEDAAEKQLIKFEHIKGGNVTPIHLYKILYENREAGNVVLMDDVDKIYNSEDALNLLKAGLDSSLVRKIAWMSEAALLRNNNIPPSFIYNGSLTFITNRDLIDEAEKGRGKDADHLEAFTTRPAYISIRFKTRRELFLWSEYMVKTNFILRQLELSDAVAEEIYAFARENYHLWRSVSIRSFIHIGRTYLMDQNRWRELAMETLCS